MALSLGLAPAATASSFAPFATLTSAPALELRADATSTASSVAALTTTFTPPATCNDNLLTMLTSRSFQIWVNEPLPLPGSVLGDCYPSEWINGYTSVVSSSSSVAPLMSPLVCPSGWKTQSDDTWTSGYMACCASYVAFLSPCRLPRPAGDFRIDLRVSETRDENLLTGRNSGFTLAAPSSAIDTDRPAYGGTCYSDFALGQVETVTVYNATALSQTREWSASTTPAQAYGHPIDGIALDYTPTSAKSSGATATGTASGSDASPSTGGTDATPSDGEDSGASGLGGGNAVFALLVAAGVALML